MRSSAVSRWSDGTRYDSTEKDPISAAKSTASRTSAGGLVDCEDVRLRDVRAGAKFES